MSPDVESVENATSPAQICRNPDDGVIIGAAIADNADCIVNGDIDLLMLERLVHSGGDIGIIICDIIAPAHFPRYEGERLSFSLCSLMWKALRPLLPPRKFAATQTTVCPTTE